jgi:signal peptidase I
MQAKTLLSKFISFVNNTSVRITVGTLSIGYAFSQKVGTISQVAGNSMLPTYMPGDWVYINKFNIFPVNRGDVYLLNNDVNKLQIKRLVGKENDIIKPRKKLKVNKTQEYDNNSDTDEEINEHMFYYRKIKRGFIWVEGDNGSVSKDSNMYGQVHISCVEGKVLFNLTNIFSNKNNSTRKETFVINEDKYFLKVD